MEGLVKQRRWVGSAYLSGFVVHVGAGSASLARHKSAARARAPAERVQEHLLGENRGASVVSLWFRSSYREKVGLWEESRQLTLRVLPSTTFLTTQSRMIAPRNIFSGLISMLLSVRQWTSMRRARSVKESDGKNVSSGRQIKRRGLGYPEAPRRRTTVCGEPGKQSMRGGGAGATMSARGSTSDIVDAPIRARCARYRLHLRGGARSPRLLQPLSPRVPSSSRRCPDLPRA